MRNRGFSLLELLLASSITILLLGLIVVGLRSGSDTARYVQTSQVLLEDLRSAGNVVNDFLATALYIYPPGTRILLNGGDSSGYTVQNPRTNNSTWEAGTDPILSAIIPPAAGETSLRFVAFYPVARRTVATTATGAANPGPDPANDDKWTLFIYIRALEGVTALGDPQKLTAPDFSTTVTSGRIQVTSTDSSGVLLADYLANGGFTVDWANARCQEIDEAGIVSVKNCQGLTLTSDNWISIIRGQFNLRGAYRTGNREYAVPGGGEGLSFQFSPRNLTKIKPAQE
ncbi:hypothetical protein [Calidithermus chliarophilus]|uniref:hypothetical protein n=1 Tax=Calidithermus chliarophilus TaxID=52023 RepID=UPI0004288B70|nr:hypothetical protein [Calidithermus chliarophilus]